MTDLNDNLLNKFIDGDLSNEMMDEVKRKFESSSEEMLHYKMLLSVHNKLKNLPGEEVTPGFTADLMVKVKRSLKSKREQNFFIVSVLSLFLLISIGIIGYLIAYYLFTAESGSSDVLTQFTIRFDDFTILLKNFFSRGNVTIIGSVFSFILIISGYFFYDSLKHRV